MLSFPEKCAMCGGKWYFNHECGTTAQRRYVASCHGCRQTWDGAVAPASMLCPDCGEPLEVEEE